ncbi:hypothetical protein GCM10011505_28690 [Tistrella bauzanensis]|uniref:Uncharacterized protein n=1 Tax=Tistrella bauzanensis TaxID=657419 RepID=A0ABQ1IKR2_9PROT|nr:hypothetical protein GCM10011505_28690 [Tistrella bauzanensis]
MAWIVSRPAAAAGALAVTKPTPVAAITAAMAIAPSTPRRRIIIPALNRPDIDIPHP